MTKLIITIITSVLALTAALAEPTANIPQNLIPQPNESAVLIAGIYGPSIPWGWQIINVLPVEVNGSTVAA